MNAKLLLLVDMGRTILYFLAIIIKCETAIIWSSLPLNIADILLEFTIFKKTLRYDISITQIQLHVQDKKDVPIKMR